MGVLSIGILAHDEAAIIARTIGSLAGQSIFDPLRGRAIGLDAIEVVVVPNGCTDATAALARDGLAQLPAHVEAGVRELAEPGKSNAWNRFVHDLARPDATMLVLMDADIAFASDDVIERLVRRIGEEPDCDVATDRPTKDYRGRRMTLFDRLSRRVSAQGGSGGGLCGQLYCGRAAVLRRIWLPLGLPVEDGFLAAMLLTAGFTREPDDRAIACVSDVCHFYEPLSGMAPFVRHEARIIVGSVINSWLFAILWQEGRHGHVGAYVRRRNAEDPLWVEEVCDRARAERGRWLVPDAFLLWRLAPLRRQSLGRAARRAPVAIAATLAAVPAVLRANAILRRPAARLHW